MIGTEEEFGEKGDQTEIKRQKKMAGNNRKEEDAVRCSIETRYLRCVWRQILECGSGNWLLLIGGTEEDGNLLRCVVNSWRRTVKVGKYRLLLLLDFFLNAERNLNGSDRFLHRRISVGLGNGRYSGQDRIGLHVVCWSIRLAQQNRLLIGRLLWIDGSRHWGRR